MSGHLHWTGEQQLAANITSRPASVPARACCILAVPVERMSFSFCALSVARLAFSSWVIFRRSRWERSFPWPILVVVWSFEPVQEPLEPTGRPRRPPRNPEKLPKSLIIRPNLSRGNRPKSSTSPNNKPFWAFFGHLWSYIKLPGTPQKRKEKSQGGGAAGGGGGSWY